MPYFYRAQCNYIITTPHDSSYYSELPDKVLAVDKSIRYCSVVDKLGHIISQKYRKGLHPLMTAEESRKNALHAIIRHSTRLPWEGKLGKSQYSLTRYENVIRVTVPLIENHLLLVSLDAQIDTVDNLVMQEILPAIEGYHL